MADGETIGRKSRKGTVAVPLHVGLGRGGDVVPHEARTVRDISDGADGGDEDEGQYQPIFDGCSGPGRPHQPVKIAHCSTPD